MSGATEESWFPCYYDIGRSLQRLEKDGFRGDEHIRLLSQQLTESFAGTDTFRFSPERLLRMKDGADAFYCKLDPEEWEISRRARWQGRIPSNFHVTLPEEIRATAFSVFKSSYCVPMPEIAGSNGLSSLKESNIEEAIVANIDKVLDELGPGFSYKRSQFRLDKRRCDLLFYNHHLRCFVLFELKRGGFSPRDAGDTTDYLRRNDKYLQSRFDRPTIGIILCRTMNEQEVEETLKNYNRPIGVATYRF
jgi:hypothetical protein